MVHMFVDTRAIEKSLNRVAASQVPFAAALGINDVLVDIRDNEVRSLEDDLDRPAPFTKRGMFVARASKRKLVGAVGFKKAQSDYLIYQVSGGTRRAKKKAVVVPVRARLNKYGNMPRGSLKRQLAKPNVFSGTVKGKSGIWQRPDRGLRRDGTRGTKRRNGLKLLAVYKSAVKYKPRLKFEPRAEELARRKVGTAISRRLGQSVKTIR